MTPEEMAEELYRESKDVGTGPHPFFLAGDQLDEIISVYAKDPAKGFALIRRCIELHQRAAHLTWLLRGRIESTAEIQISKQA
jgi:hypothetical protein